MVKNVINGVTFVKIGHYWLKWSKLGNFGLFLGAKMTSYVKIWGNWSNICFSKSFEKLLSKTMTSIESSMIFRLLNITFGSK